MAEPFEDQGGVASSNPPAIVRWIGSKIMARMVSGRARRREAADLAAKKSGGPHRVEYFHQLDDGYSHLAVQLLAPLLAHYEIELTCHLVAIDDEKNQPEPELLGRLSRRDATEIAHHFGLNFPAVDHSAPMPDPASILHAGRILANADPAQFSRVAVEVGDALWQNDSSALDRLEVSHGCVDQAAFEARVHAGTKRRAELSHYSGAMFYYGKEWFWGVDRIYHLENRLIRAGARTDRGTAPVFDRPAIETGPLRDDGSLKLEFFPSMRSPYTSIIFDTTVNLAQETGVEFVMRPVLPMVMRGVPATRQKGTYILTDTAREAETLGIEWGPFYDPIGDPVRNCYSLFPWAFRNGRGTELLSEFLRAAFFEGINTNRERGLKTVVERAGLPWDQAKTLVGNSDWEDELEENRLTMYESGLWGVPSYRLTDSDGHVILETWGQDRLWLVAREIQRQLAQRAN